MVNSMKNILNKKNYLSCDSTMEEVLTTTYYYKSKSHIQNLTFGRAIIVI